MINYIKNKIYEKLDTPERKGLSRVRFTEALEDSYNKGFKTAKEAGDEQLINLKDDLLDEYGILLATKEIELQQAIRTVKDCKEQLKDSQKAYKGYYQDTIANKRLVAEIAVQIRRLFNTSGDIYKSFLSIQDSADSHFQLMVKQDKLNRNLLGITPPLDEVAVQKNIKNVALSEDEVKELSVDIDILAKHFDGKK